jgi:hypothetical protein
MPVLFTLLSEHGVSSITTADAHTSAASSQLNWRPRRFKWTRPFWRKTKSGFCACVITFQAHYTKSLRPSLLISNKQTKRQRKERTNKQTNRKTRLQLRLIWDLPCVIYLTHVASLFQQLSSEMFVTIVIRLLVFCETNGKMLRFTIKVVGLKHSTAYSKWEFSL